MLARTFFDPPRVSSAGFLSSEVSTKNTIALLPPLSEMSAAKIMYI